MLNVFTRFVFGFIQRPPGDVGGRLPPGRRHPSPRFLFLGRARSRNQLHGASGWGGEEGGVVGGPPRCEHSHHFLRSATHPQCLLPERWLLPWCSLRLSGRTELLWVGLDAGWSAPKAGEEVLQRGVTAVLGHNAAILRLL